MSLTVAGTVKDVQGKKICRKLLQQKLAGTFHHGSKLGRPSSTLTLLEERAACQAAACRTPVTEAAPDMWKLHDFFLEIQRFFSVRS